MAMGGTHDPSSRSRTQSERRFSKDSRVYDDHDRCSYIARSQVDVRSDIRHSSFVQFRRESVCSGEYRKFLEAETSSKLQVSGG